MWRSPALGREPQPAIRPQHAVAPCAPRKRSVRPPSRTGPDEAEMLRQAAIRGCPKRAILVSFPRKRESMLRRQRRGPRAKRGVAIGSVVNRCLSGEMRHFRRDSILPLTNRTQRFIFTLNITLLLPAVPDPGLAPSTIEGLSTRGSRTRLRCFCRPCPLAPSGRGCNPCHRQAPHATLLASPGFWTRCALPSGRSIIAGALKRRTCTGFASTSFPTASATRGRWAMSMFTV